MCVLRQREFPVATRQEGQTDLICPRDRPVAERSIQVFFGEEKSVFQAFSTLTVLLSLPIRYHLPQSNSPTALTTFTTARLGRQSKRRFDGTSGGFGFGFERLE